MACTINDDFIFEIIENKIMKNVDIWFTIGIYFCLLFLINIGVNSH